MSEGTRIEARPGETPNEPAADAAANPAEPEKKKRGRASLPKHPGITETTRLEEVPKDFSPKIHAALKEEDFSDNHLDKFYDHQAAKYQTRADQLKGKAESFRKLGGMADKKTGKKLIDQMEEMRSLLAKLAAQGEDMSQFADAAAICGVEVAETPSETAA